jgi:hypothetical protein
MDTILFVTNDDAAQVLAALSEVVENYGSVSVGALYDFIGARSTFADEKLGWTDLSAAKINKDPDGFVLDLPDPKPL